MTNVYNPLKGIRECIEEASKLTRQMLGFAQAGKYKVVAVDLNEVTVKVINGWGLNDNNITINTDLLTGLPQVKGDPTQLELVVMNFLLNAWQAIDDTGEMTVKTERAVIPVRVCPARI